VSNPSLTSVGDLGALRVASVIQITDNPKLVTLTLPTLEQAEHLVIRNNPSLDDTLLAPLALLPPPARVKIVSNLGGAAALEPCPWTSDGECDEVTNDCARGSDVVDCVGALPLRATGSNGKAAP
jgi:hypothetical protein